MARTDPNKQTWINEKAKGIETIISAYLYTREKLAPELIRGIALKLAEGYYYETRVRRPEASNQWS